MSAANTASGAFTCFNDWFLSLPEGRQTVLREDKWALAESAWCTGKEAQRCAAARVKDHSTLRNFMD